MRALNTAGYFIFLFLFASAPLYAQNWQSIVLQKTKAAQTIKEIKNNVLSSQQTGRQSATRQQQQAQDAFLLTVKQFYPSAAAQQRIMQNYRHIYTRLHALPALNSYALTVQHPADLYSVSTEEIALLDQVFASLQNSLKSRLLPLTGHYSLNPARWSFRLKPTKAKKYTWHLNPRKIF